MPQNRFTLLSAVHLFLLRDDEVLLLRRFNTGYEDGKYSVVAGHLDGDEEIKAAMVREAAEEVGIELHPAEVQVVGVMHRKSDQERIDFFLAASSWSGQVANCEPQRCDELAWFHPDALPENTIPYVRRAIENYRRGTWFDSFGWETGETNFYVRPTRQEDREWIGRFVAARWGSEKIVTRGKVYDCRDLPGFVARQGERNVGLATYRIEGESCEITSLDSTRPGIGIGTALIAAVKEAARQAGCRRLCLITANDNLEALGFYQRRGFALAAVHCNALEVSRQVKPQIPLVGAHRIPLRDEIELEMPM